MKKYIITFILIITTLAVLCACKNEKTYNFDTFNDIIKNNTFKDIKAFDDRLLKSAALFSNKEERTVDYCVMMMDEYGESLATYNVRTDDAYRVTTLTATKDGGFLFVLGFEDYAYSQDVWASDKGVASRVIKCDKDGILEFDTAFEDISGNGLRFCFEKDEKYYLFGDIETPSTKQRGTYSPTDIYITILNSDGEVLKTEIIAGSDFDSLNSAEITEEGFLLSISAQSDDGDFEGSNSKGYPVDWIITINDNLEIVEKKLESGRDFFDKKLGEKDGLPVYSSDSMFNSFDAGTPTAFIDYDNYYLIISENITGEYENTPGLINARWHYTETVYSAYDNDGNLLDRDSVDSSPDYDALVEKYESSWEVME